MRNKYYGDEKASVLCNRWRHNSKEERIASGMLWSVLRLLCRKYWTPLPCTMIIEMHSEYGSAEHYLRAMYAKQYNR